MSLEEKIQSIVAESGAHMGIALRHLETGTALNLWADDSFPMCSVLKIPVLVEAFRQIEAGAFSLDERWELRTDEKNLGSGTLQHCQDGLRPTVLDLLTLMIIISDNTATDMLLNRLGKDSVERTMRSLGLEDIYLTLSIRQIFESILPSADPTQDQYDLALAREAFEPVLPEGKSTLSGYSTESDNSVSTPHDMTQLLCKIFDGTAVNRNACDAMLQILLKQQLNDRLPRFLPPGTRIAHKTGTLHGFRNDAGILYVHADSHVAVTVFSRWDPDRVKDDPVAERHLIHEIDTAFGHIGRAVFDHYQ